MEEQIYFIPDEQIEYNYIEDETLTPVKNLTDEEYNELYPNLVRKAAKFYKLIKNDKVAYKRPSRQKYLKFIMDYIACAVKNDGLKDISFTIDKSLETKTTIAYTRASEPSHIWLSPKLLTPPKDIESFVGTLNSIEHELKHLYDFKNFPVSYKKLSNEEGVKPRITLGYSYDILNEITKGKYDQEINFMKNRYYLLSPWEVAARGQATRHVAKFFLDSLQYTKNDPHYTSDNVSAFFNEISQTSLQRSMNEKDTTEDYLKYNVKEKTLQNIKQDVADYVSKLGEGCNYDGDTGEKLKNAKVIACMLNIPEIESQELYDTLFERVYNSDPEQLLDNVEMVYNLGNSINNKNGLSMITKYKDYIDQNYSDKERRKSENHFFYLQLQDKSDCIIPDELCNYFVEIMQPEKLTISKNKVDTIEKI